MLLIGLHGRAHSGKDTAYSLLEAAFPNLRFKRVAFADKLKISAAKALGYLGDDSIGFMNFMKEEGFIKVFGRSGRYEITGRRYLQCYGAKAHRDVFGDKFWVSAVLPEDPAILPSWFPDTDVLVVTDVRFINEAERILDLGGKVWFIDTGQRLPDPQDQHVTEQLLPVRLLTRVVKNNTDTPAFLFALTTALLDDLS